MRNIRKLLRLRIAHQPYCTCEHDFSPPNTDRTFSLMAFCSETRCSNWSAFSSALSFSPFIACIFFLIASIVFVAILTSFARDAKHKRKKERHGTGRERASFRGASNDGRDAGLERWRRDANTAASAVSAAAADANVGRYGIKTLDT